MQERRIAYEGIETASHVAFGIPREDFRELQLPVERHDTFWAFTQGSNRSVNRFGKLQFAEILESQFQLIAKSYTGLLARLGLVSREKGCVRGISCEPHPEESLLSLVELFS